MAVNEYKYGAFIQKLSAEFGIEAYKEIEEQIGKFGAIENVLSNEIGRIVGEAFNKIVTEFKENGVPESMIVRAFGSYIEQSDIESDFNDYVYQG